ncbi:MAG: PSD1 and planctomycete cytochrome C domain-containing protein [Gemmataceae bacterium]|nr:PSD1 and planctomycete cytochrome C domain-containing protein [Gemmataceae bacterium]
MRCFRLAACGLIGWCLATASSRAADPQAARSPAAASEFFEKSIRPLLANHCFECHGPQKQRAGLRLDSRDNMLAGGDTGPAIVPGHPEQSLLVKAIGYKDELRMPPKNPLAPAQVAALTQWIKQGAAWPQPAGVVRSASKESGFRITPEDRAFWAFQPIADPPLPRVNNAGRMQTALDAFIMAKLEDKGLTPAPPADPRTLLRRMYFDVIGLPPTAHEVEEFVRAWDGSSAKRQALIARVADRLLSSPHYGERWARHWLDVARYGEDQAHTFQARKYPQGFRYRDWLIKAFNDDMPYDQFIKEQLAADLLPRANGERIDNLPALGFFALGPVYYGDPKRLDQIDDRIDTLSRGLLGLTVACARCHDHKYDPIATKDYYALAGVIASTDYVEISLAPGKEGQPLALPSRKDKEKKQPPRGPFIHSVRDGKAVTMKVHIRGNPNMLGEEAPRRMMSILTAETAPSFSHGSGRLELANAIAAKDNPLTARVMVNRIWQHYFGKGLVRTPSNFGELGERPTHPELLDYLASRFIESGWSMKAIHRMILLSATYQQESGIKPRDERSDSRGSADPENRLLWHMNRRRLDVEAWRDAMLAVSGKLDRRLGGPSGDLASPDNRRRTLYGSVSRHELNPLLRLFDFPDPNITADERTVTTVPLQQLYVLNSEFLIGNAKALAARLATAEADDADRIRAAFVLLYGRPATPREVAIGLEYVSAPAPASGLSRWEQYSQVLLSTNEFMYVD